jgi:hypothetical protein
MTNSSSLELSVSVINDDMETVGIEIHEEQNLTIALIP